MLGTLEPPPLRPGEGRGRREDSGDHLFPRSFHWRSWETGRAACPATGPKWGPREEGPGVTQRHSSPSPSDLLGALMLTLEEAWGPLAPLRLSPSYASSYPQVCTPLVISL